MFFVVLAWGFVSPKVILDRLGNFYAGLSTAACSAKLVATKQFHGQAGKMSDFSIFDGHNDLLSCLWAEKSFDGAAFFNGRDGDLDGRVDVVYEAADAAGEAGAALEWG